MFDCFDIAFYYTINAMNCVHWYDKSSCIFQLKNLSFKQKLTISLKIGGIFNHMIYHFTCKKEFLKGSQPIKSEIFSYYLIVTY